jgi:hypothetical protein
LCSAIEQLRDFIINLIGRKPRYLKDAARYRREKARLPNHVPVNQNVDLFLNVTGGPQSKQALIVLAKPDI